MAGFSFCAYSGQVLGGKTRIESFECPQERLLSFISLSHVRHSTPHILTPSLRGLWFESAASLPEEHCADPGGLGDTQHKLHQSALTCSVLVPTETRKTTEKDSK